MSPFTLLQSQIKRGRHTNGNVLYRCAFRPLKPAINPPKLSNPSDPSPSTLNDGKLDITPFISPLLELCSPSGNAYAGK